MEYKDIEIGKVYKLKRDAKVWCINIQMMVQFPQDEVFVEITAKCYNNHTLFANVLDPNLFGVIRNCEIDFSFEDVDGSGEQYENADIFSATKKPFFYCEPVFKNDNDSKDNNEVEECRDL